MHTTLCDVYGIDSPIFAFSHSPAVVLAVTQAGGFGVLDAFLATTALRQADTPAACEVLEALEAGTAANSVAMGTAFHGGG